MSVSGGTECEGIFERAVKGNGGDAAASIGGSTNAGLSSVGGVVR